MKVITPAHKGKGSYVGLTSLRKRQAIGDYSMKSGGPVFLTFIKSQMTFGIPTAVGVGGHGLLEIAKGDFSYVSQDEFLTIINSSAVTSLVVTKGAGAGTTVTDSIADREGLVSIERRE